VWVALAGVLGCDPVDADDTSPVSRRAVAPVELQVDSARPETDERPLQTARVVTAAGSETLENILEVRTSPDGRTVAVLEASRVLRVLGEPTRGTMTEVEPGVRVCDGGRVVLARQTDPEEVPPTLELMVWDPHLDAAAVTNGGDRLDRVVSLSPDCTYAIVVVSERGMPVVLAVELPNSAGVLTRPIVLANRDLPRTPGRRPPGFVPVPELDAPVTWSDARTMHWTVLGEHVTLTISGGEP
jgi:hypothetical protein